MRIARHVKHASLALIALSSVGALHSAYAVGTPSGTTISNQATVDYSVGGVSQAQITSAAASFVVDTRIDFTVSEVSGKTGLRIEQLLVDFEMGRGGIIGGDRGEYGTGDVGQRWGTTE